MRRRICIVFALGTLAGLVSGCSSSGGGSSKPASKTSVPKAATVPTSAPSAEKSQLSATLTAQAVVTPANKPWNPPPDLAGATGKFSGLLNPKAGTLTWNLSYQGLGKPSLTLADIHAGPRNKFGAILVRLCGPCKPGGDSGVVKVTGKLTSAAQAGNSWVTVITQKYPNGALRGQISAK